MTSWEVRAATALAWLGVLPGVACLVLAAGVMKADPGFLFVVLPFVMGAALFAGAILITGAVTLAVRLHRCDRAARLHAALVGAGMLFVGLFVLSVSPAAGLGLMAYGGALVWLMATPGARRDLGSWSRPLQQPAPWGSTPGKGLWSAEPVQQGPWSPDPTTLPWLSWKGVSGPRPPWWQTWRAGLQRGLPVWEAGVLMASLLAFSVALVAVLLPGPRGTGVLLVALSIGGVMVVERRLRQRLSTVSG